MLYELQLLLPFAIDGTGFGSSILPDVPALQTFYCIFLTLKLLKTLQK